MDIGGTQIDQHILDWFRDERGIREETLEAFGVTQEDDWLVFPYPNGEKRRLDPTKEGRRRFLFTEGRAPELFFGRSAVGTSTMFLVEGETDAMRLYQELRTKDGNLLHTTMALSGIETWQPHFAEYFKSAENVVVILDNDADYNVQARVENLWKQVRRDLGVKKVRRVYLPPTVKDLCEFFQRGGDLDLLRELSVRKVAAKSRFERLDLTKEPPPMNWLVDDLICMGDVTLMVGDPGLGKSWLSMSLATAIANGDDTWLGRTLRRQGRVLMVDEENPEDIIFNRFKKLGLKEPGNIDYLYRPGIWLNKDPDAILEEALEINPVLITIDSLTRVHSEDENNANAMATMFRDAITPLSRETGAAVVVIHHSNKGESNNSYIRARGSGDISAVVDAALDVRPTGSPGRFTVALYKSRRRLAGEITTVDIKDTPEGGVRLLAQEDALPF